MIAWLNEQRACLGRIAAGDDANAVLAGWVRWLENTGLQCRVSVLIDSEAPADVSSNENVIAKPIVGLDEQRIGSITLRGPNASAADPDQVAFAAQTIALIIERSRANRALRERESELARVQRIGKVGGVVVDLRNGFHNHRSPEYLAIHGLPPSAVNETHEDWVARLHPDDRETTELRFKEALRNGDTDYNAEYRIIRPSDGEVRWILVQARIERDGAGRPLRLIGAHIDITDRVLARQNLRESEERFRLIANSAPVPIWVTKLDRQRAFANQAYLDFLGLPYDEALAFDWRTILHPDDLPRIVQESVAGEASLKPFVLEARYRRADGQWRWIMSESQPRWDAMGRHIGFIGVAHDITAAKDAQLQTEAQLDQTREELFQSRKMDAVGQLTGGIAHDFNNLLMAVLGSLDMVRKRLPADNPLMRFIDNATEGAERGAALTQRMLAFARRQNLNTVAVDLRQLVDGMTGLLRSSLGPTYTVQTRFAEGLGLVHADPQQLELALLNLAVNARDAMPRRGTIVIEAHNDVPKPGADAQPTASITVKDSGSGMDEATLARAMEPFFTTKGIGKGTGLGLSMVHGMIQQLGGKMTIDSKPGHGTTVTLCLPLAAATDAPAQPKTVRVMQDAPARRVVLAVDDDPLVLLNTAAMLEDLGHTVFEATSGAKALDLLSRESSIDLVITDQAMPNMTGVELARSIRVRAPSMPIIIATGYAELPDDAPAGMPRLAKPFRQDELGQLIASLGLSAVTATASAAAEAGPQTI